MIPPECAILTVHEAVGAEGVALTGTGVTFVQAASKVTVNIRINILYM